MRLTTFLLLLLTLLLAACSQSSLNAPNTTSLEAFTKDGRSVVLHENGTWQYQEAVPASYSSSTEQIFNSEKGFFKFEYNPQIWRVVDTSNEAAEFMLVHRNGEGYVMVITERIGVPLNILKRIAVRNARQAASDVQVIFREKRLVNGAPVLAMDMQGRIQGIVFRYHSYYWSGRDGSLQFITFTSQSLFEKYQEDFDTVLNSMQIENP